MKGWDTPDGHHVERVRRAGSLRCMTTDRLASACESCREHAPFKRQNRRSDGMSLAEPQAQIANVE